MKKKIAVLLALVLIIGLSVMGGMERNKTYAREAQMYIELPDSIKKENEFKIKVILNSDVNLYSINAYITYNSELLEFVPDNECITGAAGMLEIKDTYAAETKNAVYEITFKAIDTGVVDVALQDIYLIDYENLDYMEVLPSQKQFEIDINQKVETDTRLSDLIIAPGELTEVFSPEQSEYEVHVGMDVEEIGISAIPMDESSVVGLEMPEKLQPGENKIVITVTALSGNVNTYIIKVYREELVEETTQSITEDKNTEGGMQEQTEETSDTEEVTKEQITEAVYTEEGKKEQTTEVDNVKTTEEQTIENAGIKEE